MVREVLRGGHDLLMKEAEPNESVLFGSTDMHLLRACPCPVWLFKPEHAGRAFAQVLAAGRPRTTTRRGGPASPQGGTRPEGRRARREDPGARRLPGRQARGRSSTSSTPGRPPARGCCGATRCWRRSRSNATWRTREPRPERPSNGSSRGSPDRPGRRFVHLLKGDPADVIAEFAKTSRVDLIVMGTVARTGIPGLLIGNTAETILQRVDCSVLAVKPDGFVSPVTLVD